MGFCPKAGTEWTAIVLRKAEIGACPVLSLQAEDGRFSRLVTFLEDWNGVSPGDLLKVKISKVGATFAFASYLETLNPAALFSSKAVEFLLAEARKQEPLDPESSALLKEKALEFREQQEALVSALRILARKVS